MEEDQANMYGSVASMYAAQYKNGPDPADPMLVGKLNSSAPGHYGGLPVPPAAAAARPKAAPQSDARAALAKDPAAGYRRRREMTALIGNHKHMEWNDKYQLLMESVPTGFVKSAEEFNKARSFVQDLLVLTKDFVNLAAMYGKIIVSEKEMSVDDKTIKPVALGGAGSGAKYMQRGIFFKFPQVDDYGIYNGDDDWASKAGGHELKGLMGFKSAGIKELHLPLMALIDYRGYRLIAVSSVPISRDTLVYGSRDGGQRVVNKDPKAAHLMERFGEFMGLKSHLAGTKDEGSVVGPADIEVHRGFDNRYYVVDFARVFPPEQPRQPGEHLINQFRPEFVRKYDKALNSDAYSNMNNDPDEAAEGEESVRIATERLHSVIIPEFVAGFERYLGSGGAGTFRRGTSTSAAVNKDSSYSDHIFSKAQSSLITEMHRAGINIRHLGKLHSIASVKELKLAILVEMVTRCMKVNLRKRWRSHTIKYPSAEDESYKRVTVRYLNQVLGRSDKTSLYWTFELLPQVMQKFEDALTPEEQTELGKAASSDCILKMEISKRLEQLCGIEYSSKLADKFERDPEWFLQEFPIPELHVVRIHPVIKTTNTIPFMEGLLLLHSQGLESSGSTKAAADRFWVLKGAAKRFKESLERVPGGRAEILALASVQYERAFCGLPIAQSVRILDNAQHTLEYLLQAYPNDPEAFVLYADVVHLSGRMRNNASILHTAASYYKKHLDSHPNDSKALYQCGQCLLRLYYLESRNLEHLAASLKFATRAVDLLPHDGDAWALLARTMAIKTANDPDPALFAVCDDAFSRTFLYMLEHRNSDVMYRWATYVLHKAISFDNVDLLLVGTMKLKAAVEKEVKPEYFTAMRSCIHTIREKLNEGTSDSRWSPSTVAMVSSWLKVLKQAIKSLDQRCYVIPWDDIDLVSPLSSSEFHFLYKAKWYDYHVNEGSDIGSRDSSEPASPAPELAKSTSDSLTASSRNNSTASLLRGSVSQSLFKRLREKKFTQRIVVIKLVTKGIAIQADKDRWANELRVMQHFEDPPEQLLRLHGRTYDDHHEGLVIEYFQGLPALERLQLINYSTPVGPAEQLRSRRWKFITSIAYQTAIGLDYMHNSNVLWAAVSPRNLLVDEKGGVKLTNFESSQIISADDPLGEATAQADPRSVA
eukprot:TRINITY_DN15587_c0_g2_i1.p1 TRINITY_DN15587_c0_g2~~TRINITY_DN15587_c0_g2_i1.p1  ORF type:complete len:1160 (+),score=219.51 TRINITY_DN15587_c0_g2_i1:46-3525(+)